MSKALRDQDLKTAQIDTGHTHRVKTGQTKGGAAYTAACVDDVLGRGERCGGDHEVNHPVNRTSQARMGGKEIVETRTLSTCEEPEVQVLRMPSRTIQRERRSSIVGFDARVMRLAPRGKAISAQA